MANSLSPQPGVKTVDDNSDNWHRVSPLAILYYIEKLFIILLNNLFYMLPALFVLWDKIQANPWIATVIISGILGLISFFSVWSFMVFRYRLSEGTLEVKSGIFSKKHVNLPFNRIQNVKIEQPFYYRFFNFSSIAFDSGGSLSQEARLIALPLSFAKRLQLEINEYKSSIAYEASVNEDNFDQGKASSKPADEMIENTRSISDLILHGITSNRIYILLAALAPFVDDIFSFVGEKLEGVGIDVQSHLDNDPIWQIGIFAISLFLLVIGLMSMLSIIGAIIIFFDYTLSRTHDKYIRRSGLITKHEVSVPLSRIQVAVMKQDFLDILFGRFNLRLDQLNAQISTMNAGGTDTSKLLVPSVFAYECRDIIERVFPNHQLHDIDFIAISKRFITRYLSFIVLPITGILSYSSFHNDGLSLLVPVGVFIGLTSLVYGRWLRWGYQVNRHYIYIQKGLLGRDKYCLPITKIQKITVSQSYFMKKNQLASLKIYLASGSYNIPLIDQEHAQSIYDYVLYKVESQAKSWM